MPSYFVPTLTPETTLVTLEGDEYHHLSHVKRISIGQDVQLNNGCGVIAEGRIKAVTKRDAEIEIVSSSVQNAIMPHFAIAFALLKNRHDELLIEKCTELRASAFFPLVTEHSVKTPSLNTLTRYEKIALAAIKQCDNPWLPHVYPVQTLEAAIKNVISEGYSPLLCSEKRPDSGINSLDKQMQPCFLIGPEGGFSPSEFAYLNSQKVPSISICHLITRAETAAIAAAAQFIALL
jgi:16S rRNA (uracil1498-N3)-methyltransferase